MKTIAYVRVTGKHWTDVTIHEVRVDDMKDLPRAMRPIEAKAKTDGKIVTYRFRK